jgi:hypothetical protein
VSRQPGLGAGVGADLDNSSSCHGSIIRPRPPRTRDSAFPSNQPTCGRHP